MLRGRAALIFVTLWCLHFPFDAYGEYNSFELGRAAGGYVFAVGLLEYLGRTNCSYAIRKAYNVSLTVQSIFPIFQPSDQRQIQELSMSEDFQSEIAETVEGMRSAARNDGLDEKTVCGVVVANVSLLYDTALQSWNYAKSKFAQ